jgi:hypothetical protein
MKFNSVLLVGLVSIGLLTISADSAFAGGYFANGNPGGLRAASSYRLAPTPANQAWERNNAWANYTGQNRQGNVSTGTPGSALQHNAVTR